MNLDDLKSKVLNREVCRLCLTEESELFDIFEKRRESLMTPESFLRKFNVVELNKEISLTTICKICINILEAFDKFHQKAVFSQETILKALSNSEVLKDVISKNETDKEALIGKETVKNTVMSNSFNEQQEIDDELLSEKASTELQENFQLEFVEEIVNNCEEDSNDESQRFSFNLDCEFCLKTYKRESHLKRHIEKFHQDGKIKRTKKLKKISCNFCGKKFLKEKHFNDHINEISCVSLTSPECRFCKESFLNIPQLQNHLAANHQDGKFKHECQICFKSFATASNKSSHMESHNAENSIKCEECDRNFKSVLYLRKHQKAIHTKVEKVCTICWRKFDSQLKFDYHIKSHELVKRYKCDYESCDKSFMQHHHLENHKTTHTGISKFLCFKCGKEFKQDCNLKVHLKCHENENSSEKVFKCSYQDCEKAFQSNSSFRSHKKTHEKSSQCPECGKKFAQKSSLRVHFQTHFRQSGDKPFKCPQLNCDRRFYQERSVKYHVRTAHGIGEPIKKRFSCQIYFCDFCPQSFKLQSLLKRHLISHIEDEKLSRKHKCDKCEARFKRPEHLRLHTNSVHLKLRPYKCSHPDCRKSFTQIGDRNVHMKVHSDEKPHVCFCQKAFRLAKGLKAHQKTHVGRLINDETVV